MLKHILIQAVVLSFWAMPLLAQPITLRDCLDRAARTNPNLRVVAFDQRIAAEGERVARSGYLPRLDFQGGYTAQLEPQAFDLGGASAQTQEADYGTFNLSLYQTLYDFGRTDARAKRAHAIREAAKYAYAGQEQEIFLRVVQSYYGILEAEKLEKAAGEEVAQMGDHLRVATNLYEQGVVTRNDLLQAEVRLASSRQRQLAADNRLNNAWLQLNFLTGHAPSFRGELDETIAAVPATTESDVERSLDNRPEIRALRKTLEGDELSVRETRSGYYPELFAQLGVDYVQNKYVKEQAIMAATVGLKINLFDGMATTGRYRQAVMNRSRTEAALRQLQESILLEYQTAKNDAQVAKQRIAVTEQAIRQGEENLRINKDRYQAQVGTATDVIDAQTLLTQTRTDYYQSLYDYQVAVARIKKALGEL